MSSDLTLLEEVAAANSASLQMIDLGSLRAAVSAAAEQGSVVMVTKGARESSYALAVGVDEVVRAEGLTRQALEQTIERARGRADVRLAYSFGCTSAEYNAVRGFGLLTSSVLREISHPLRLALVKSEVLAHELARFHERRQKLAHDATDVASMAELMSDFGAPGSRMNKMLDQQRILLERAESFVSVFETCDQGPGHESDDTGALLRQVADLVRGHLAPADIHVEADGVCLAATSRPFLICLVAVVLAQAVDLLRESRRAIAGIDLRASEEEDVVVVEIEYRGAPPVSAVLLRGVRDCLTSIRGDLLVDSDHDRTLVRLIVPRLLGARPVRTTTEARALQSEH